MKYTSILPALLLLSNVSFSQEAGNTLVVNQSFATMAMGSSLNSARALQTFSTSQTDGSQFFIPDWKKGEVVLNNNEAYSKGYLFVYDKVRQELFIREKDSSLILLGNKEQIRSFSLKDDDKQYQFINSSRFSELKPSVFYQLLVEDSAKLTLLKYTKASLVKADMTDMEKVKQGEVYDAYVDKYAYYIVNGKKDPQPVLLSTKGVRQAFTDMGLNPAPYMHDHRGLVNEDYLIDMVKQFNQ